MEEDLIFQSTPLREGRLLVAVDGAVVRTFQSTPLREGRRSLISRASLPRPFQSTPLREGRLAPDAPGRASAGSFNPRPFVRGDASAAPLQRPL